MYNDIIIRDNLNEAKNGVSNKSAHSVDIIPYGQDILTWEEAKKNYGKILYDSKSSVIAERTINCYVRGKNLSSKETTGKVQLFLMPFSVFCNPEEWYHLKALDAKGTKYVSEVPMIAKKGAVISTRIPEGEVCINQNSFILDNQYLKAKSHYCLCGIVSTPDHTVIIPEKFESNLEMDAWVTVNPNVSLLNIYPVAFKYSQLDYSFRFGNIDSKKQDFDLVITFSCNAKEKWSKKSLVRVQCTDSRYFFDFKDLHISEYKKGVPQTVRVTLLDMPPKFTATGVVYVENVDPAPASGIISTKLNIHTKKIPTGYEEQKLRFWPAKPFTGEDGYILTLGECFIYNEDITLQQFYQIQEEMEDAERRLKQELQREYERDSE